MIFRENDYTDLPEDLIEDSMQADSTWGDEYKDMEYLGSTIRDCSTPGWFDCMDFFYDAEGRMRWRSRYFRVDQYGELIFKSSSEYHFGRKIPAWDRAGKS